MPKFNAYPEITGLGPDDTFLVWQDSSGSVKQISRENLNIVTKVTNIAALKALVVTFLADAYQVSMAGYYNEQDGGGGVFVFDQSSVAPDNGGTIISPTAGTGRWLRLTNGEISVKAFGAKGDNATDDTARLQAALSYLESGVTRTLYIPAGTYITKATLNFPNASSAYVIYGDSRDSSVIKYDKASAYGSMMSSIVSAGDGSAFRDITLDTNQKATNGFFMGNGNVAAQSCKNMRFEGVYVINLASGSVGWRIGDQASTGFALDAFNFIFSSSGARGYDDSIGWIVDSDQAFNIAWYNCSSGYAPGLGRGMLSSITTLRGSGFRVYNHFCPLLQAGGDPWVINHTGGSFSVFGMNTEDWRVIKARRGPIDGSGIDWYDQDNQRIYLANVEVNCSTGQGGTSVDSQLNAVFDTCSFGTIFAPNTYYRTITTTKAVFAKNCFIGTTAGNAGTWNKSATFPSAIYDDQTKQMVITNLALRNSSDDYTWTQLNSIVDGADVSVWGPTIGAAGGEYTNFAGFSWYPCGADVGRTGMKFYNQGVINSRFWVDDSGNYRCKSSNPTSQNDGTVIGTQTFSATHIYNLGDTDLQLGESVKLVGKGVYRTTGPKEKGCCGIYAGPSYLLENSFGQTRNNDDPPFVAVVAIGDSRHSQYNNELIGALVDCEVEQGDLLCTSSVPGRLTNQGDDVIRSFTVAKVMEPGDQNAPIYAYLLS